MAQGNDGFLVIGSYQWQYSISSSNHKNGLVQSEFVVLVRSLRRYQYNVSFLFYFCKVAKLIEEAKDHSDSLILIRHSVIRINILRCFPQVNACMSKDDSTRSKCSMLIADVHGCATVI